MNKIIVFLFFKRFYITFVPVMRKLLLIHFIIMMFMPLAAKDEVVSFKLSTANGLPDNNIRRIKQDSAGFLYFYSLYDVYRYDGYSFTRLTSEEAEKMERILPPHSQSVTIGTDYDNRGNRYTVNRDGTLVYEDRRTGEKITLKIFEPIMLSRSNSLKCRVLTDKRGAIWVSVNGNGLFFYNRKTRHLRHITSTDHPALIDNNFVVYIKEDNMGRIWVSQEHYGVACLSVVQQNCHTIDLNGSADNRDNIRMIRRIGDDLILIADNYGTLYQSDGLLRDIRPLSAGGNNYISALVDRRGRLWLGSRNNGVSVDGRKYGTGRVDCIMEDAKGRIWLCGINGDVIQAELDNDGRYTERHFFSDIDMLSPRIMTTDNAGNIWLGASKGLFRFNADSPQKYRRVSNLPVRSLLFDSKGRLWVGTQGHGLYSFKDKSFFTTTDGLPNGVVQFIAEEANGHLCIGTEDGCVFYDPDRRTIVQSLYFSDRQARNFYNENSGVLLNDGRMALGTLDGIVVAEREKGMKDSLSMPIALTGLSVNGTPADTWPLSHDISLAHDRNSLMLSFSNFAYGQNRETVYSFRLEGYEDEWSPLSNTNFVTYKNLPPGSYTLNVRCRMVNGPWNETQVNIRISPPWWQTWWAWLFYIIAAVAVSYVVYRQIVRVAKLRRCIAVERELTDYKLKFFTNISHEFRTPLTLIQGSMDRLKQLPDTPLSARVPLDNMQRNVDRMLRLINQLLEFRCMQNNKLSLSLEETDIVAFVYNLCRSFNDTAEQKRISLSFVPSAKSIKIYIDRGFIDKAVYNLLSNAFKYTPDGGSVTVRVKTEDDRLKIICEDTGCGVPEEQREEIFDRFAHGRMRRDSLGIGLDLTAELIRTHHGTIRCDGNTGGGSIFTITLPADKSVYEEKDFLCEKVLDSGEPPVERQGFTEKLQEVMPEPMNSHRVLVVEDDADIASYLKQELGRYFTVDTAGDGEEAWKRLNDEEASFSLIITDAMMPRMNGFQLLRRLRKNERIRHLPVIMLTALNNEDEQLKGLEVGADAYITKPFSLTLLLLQCRNLLQHSDYMKDITAGEKKPEKSVSREIITDERDRKLLVQLSVWVDSHLASPDLSVDKFAEEMGYGRTTFYNKLKALTGNTPNEYIRERRLQKAYELLGTMNNVTVAEVAYQVGMATPQYLSTIFKKRFGISPTRLQKGAKKEEGVLK